MSADERSGFEQQVLDTYRKTIEGLYAAVASWTSGDRALAEDLVQETWLRAVRHWGRHGMPEHPAAWLRTVARNLLVSHARRHGRELPADEAALAAEGAPEADAVDRQVVAESLQRVGASSAVLLRSFHLEGMSVREIARDQGISERAVEGRLRRARRTLRRWLGAEDEESRS